MNEAGASRRPQRGGKGPQDLERRLEILRLRGAAHRLDIVLARREAAERLAGLRHGLALLGAIAQTVMPRRWRKQWANQPWLRLPTILGPVVVPLLLRPLWRWWSGRRRRGDPPPEKA